MNVFILLNVWKRISNLEKETRKLMSATDDLKAAQAALDKAVADTAAFLKTVAGQIAGGVSAADAEAIAADMNAQAASLEAAIAPPAPTA